MEIIFHSHANKTHFHKKGCALGLILKVRVLELGSGQFLQHFDVFHDLQLNRHFIQRNVTCSIKLIEHSKLLFIKKSINVMNNINLVIIIKILLCVYLSLVPSFYTPLCPLTGVELVFKQVILVLKVGVGVKIT